MIRRGRENFRFTSIELGALALSFTATSVFVFFLGFYVGRRVAAAHATVGENVARIPVGSPPGDDAPPPRAAAPATRASGASASATPPQPSRPASPTSPPPVQAPAARTVAPALSPPAAATQGASSAQVRTPPRPLAVPKEPQTADAAAAADAGTAYTVQVLATRYHSEAESLTAMLKKKGYGAYLVQVDDAGGTWYRVRIGHFEDSEAARRLATRASRELGLTQAYVSPISSGSR